jgi:uncharacterized protein (DUF58 family)
MGAFKFNPADLHRLNRLVFLPRLASMDHDAGGRRSRRSGDGSEFLDFRPYIAGDDVRKVDWSLYGRLRQLFVRINESPRQLAVMLLIDTSRSMGFGAATTKLEQAQRIACALGFVAMRGGDRVYAAAFGDSVNRGVGPLRGAGGLAGLVKFLQTLEPAGKSNLSDALQFARATRRNRGLIIILSDFLNVAGRDAALRSFGEAGGTVLAVQILDPLDRGEGLKGKVRLRDSETGQMVDVDLDRAGMAQFQSIFETQRARLESICTGRKRHYVQAWTHESYLGVVCDALRARGILR